MVMGLIKPVSDGVELEPLGNPAGPNNIQTGYQAYNQFGSIIYGANDSISEDFPAVSFTFFNYDGTELHHRLVFSGNDCADPVSRGWIGTPTKQETDQYTYTFKGWADSIDGSANSNLLKNVKYDTNVWAVYTATVKSYTVTYYDSDGYTVLHTAKLGYGGMPSFTPSKVGYTFDGWVPEITSVTGNTSYTAKWIAGKVIANGTFDAGAEWKLFETGDFLVSGSGETDSYATTTAMPWNDKKSQIKNIVIEDGVTKVGANCFYGCSEAVSVTFGVDVAYIGQAAFRACTALTSAIFEDTDTWYYHSSTGTSVTGNSVKFTVTNPTTAATTLKNNTAMNTFFKK